MSYAAKDGKDTVLFIDEEYVNSQPDVEPVKKEEEKQEETVQEQSDQAAAYDPETGEINWDCPCLGGMATGPCGEQFKGAFSCFVYSEAEPKGVDCIEKFKAMQDCFRQYPDVYGDEIDDDDDEEEEKVISGDNKEEASSEEAVSAPKQDSPKEDSVTPTEETTTVASSPLEAEETSSGSFTSWVSSWF